MPKIQPKVFEALGDMMRPPPPPPPVKNSNWTPRQTAEQEEVFFSEAKYILCWSEKGSGKSLGCLDRVVRHLYENENALGIILVKIRGMANQGGAWDKLQQHTLPTWRDGNRDKEGKLIDHGLGLAYTDVKFDSQHNEFIWVQNMHGGWSKIVLISAPHANQLRDRIRGYEPSIVFVDELTSCDSKIYFSAVSAQIGRRVGIAQKQQVYLAACNPDSQRHWVYQTWFIEAFNEETGEWDPDFQTIYFPVASNIFLTEGYIDHLKKTYRGDPVEALRMIGGEWADRPSGDALFGQLFNEAAHIRPLTDEGKPDLRRRLVMDPKHPILVGLDPGSVHNAFLFIQWLLIEGRMRWVLFDEFVTIQRRIDYPSFIPMVMRRVKWLREKAGGTQQTMPQIWLSDNSAFNQYRAAQGSFDSLEIDKIYEASRTRYALEPSKVRPGVKFNGSQIALTRLVQRMVAQDEILISTACPKFKAMILLQESKPQKAGEPFDPELSLTPRRCEHEHVLKAFGYVVLTASVNPGALLPPSNSTQRLYGGSQAA